MKRYLIVMLMAAIATGAATAAQAKKPGKKYKRPHAVYVQPYSHFGFSRQDGIVYSSTGSVVPAYVLSTPEKCWTEDGYNRWSTCDGGPR